MTDVRVTEAAPRHAQTVQALVEQTFRDTYAEHNTDADMEQYVAENFSLQHIKTELDDPTIFYLLLETASNPAGYAKLKWAEPENAALANSPNLELCRFYIDQPYHGQGLAQTLMQACIQQTRAQQGRGIWLGVWSQNHRAIRFYSKEGFEKVGSQVFVLGKDVQYDDILYLGV